MLIVLLMHEWEESVRHGCEGETGLQVQPLLLLHFTKVPKEIRGTTRAFDSVWCARTLVISWR